MPKNNSESLKLLAILAIAVLAFLVLISPVQSQTVQSNQALIETRYCGAPFRLVDGSIRRRADVIYAFRKIHPCPSTLLHTGACPGWAVNHVIPLACGGCDQVSNLQWLPLSIKTGTSPHAVDRFERKINASTPSQPDTATCVNIIVP